MTENHHFNGQIPTDPTAALLVLLAVAFAGQLTPDQAQALAATGGLADLALLLLAPRGGR